MSHSKYTSTFKRFALTLLMVAVVLIGLNELLSLFVNRNHIVPDILSGYGAQGVLKFWQLTDAGQTPLVFTGSSQMKQAVVPAQFDAQVSALSRQNVTSVNVSIIGATVKVSRDVIQSLILPNGIHTIIYGIEMRDLRIDADYDYNYFADSSLGYALARPSPLERSMSLWVLRNIPMVEYHNNIGEWLLGHFAVADTISGVDEGGYWNVSQIKSRSLDTIRMQFVPFQPDNDALADLNSIFTSCQQPEIRCIVVNMPLHKAAYGAISDQDEALYRQVLYPAAKQGNISIWDFNSKSCQTYFEDKDFYDLNHLNNSGAQKFTDAIADLYVQQVLGKALPTPQHTDCVTVTLP